MDRRQALDVDVTSVDVWTALLAASTVSDQAAYDIVKTVFEQKAALVAASPAATTIDLANQAAVKLPVAFHPGALKYYAEKGIRITN